MANQQTIDGGFAWLVLFAIFCTTVLCGMMVYSPGVLNTAILEEVDNDLFKTSWVGSSMLAIMAFTGPVAGVITRILGYRVSCFGGGVFMLIGLTAASFVNDVTGLIITYSVIAGFGTGLAYNASFVVPGSYFIKRRGLAYGITASGIAVGMFAAGPLCQILLDEYRLRGCLLIMGAILSNVCVAASILRPIPTTRPSTKTEHCVIALKRFNDSVEDTHLVRDTECAEELFTNIKNGQTNESPFNTGSSLNFIRNLDRELVVRYNEDTAVNQDHHEFHGSDVDSTDPDTRCCNSDQGKQHSAYALCDTEEPGMTIGRSSIGANTHSSVFSCFGSIKNVNIHNKYGFIFYCLSFFFWFLGEGTCFFHLPNYAINRGSTQNEATSLFTATGMTSLASRLLIGCAVSDPSVDHVTLHVGLIGMAGVLTLCFPLFSNSFPLQMIFSAAYGMYSGGPNTLISPLTIDLVGLDHLSVAVGIENFCSGIAFCIGPPLASFIYSETGRYELTFVFAGIALLTSATFGALVGSSRKSSPVKGPKRIDHTQ